MHTEKRFSHLAGAISFICFIIINFAAWRFFFAPTNGMMKLFTPMYGLSIIAMLLFCIICVSDIFEGNNESGGLAKGAVLTIWSFLLFYVIYYGFLWNFLGKYGITYFSPQSIIDVGGTGAEMWNARESSSTAITYLAAALIFVTILWDSGLGKYPWESLSSRARGISKFFAITFFSVIIYAIFFHPNVTALFVPKQSFAGVVPWWEDVAMTSSAFYHLGWMMMSLAVVVLISETLNGWPLSYLSGKGSGVLLKLLGTLAVSIGLGFAIFNALHWVMNYYWYEPFLGGSYTDDPRFRHLHIAEIATFAMIAIYLWKSYFNNWPTNLPAPVAGIIRVAIVTLITGGVYLFFYSETIGPKYIDRVPGIGSVDDTALCWGLMTMVILFIHAKFFGNWPLVKKDLADG